MKKKQACEVRQNDIYQQDPSVISIDEDDIMRLFSPTCNKMTELLGTGPEIWHSLDGTRTVADICKLIMENYDVEFKTANHDIVEFIQKLREERFFASPEELKTQIGKDIREIEIVLSREFK